MKLSQNFTLAEFTFSETAARFNIDNTPSAEVLENLKITAAGMETIRTLLGNKSIFISSALRVEKLNKKIGSSSTSDHINGWCVDFVCPKYGTPSDIVKAIVAAGIKFDQLIDEGTWVHISFSPKMRMQVMKATFDSKGKATYTKI